VSTCVLVTDWPVITSGFFMETLPASVRGTCCQFHIFFKIIHC
jgi:hypothetical protein